MEVSSVTHQNLISATDVLNNSLNTDVPKPFIRSKTGNYLGYNEENPWTPPAQTQLTVAACLDKYYWLNHF